MLIGVIGSPGSGKTTASSIAFGEMKAMGIVCEFIPEQARIYIAQRRFESKLGPDQHVVLTDEDQLKILRKQLYMETLLRTVCSPDTIVITDSSCVNSLFYMTPEFRQGEEVKKLIAMALKGYSRLFYCPTIKNEDDLTANDSNRIHTYEQALRVDQQVPRIIQDFSLPTLTPLAGGAKARAKTMSGIILQDRIKSVVDDMREEQGT